MRRHELLGGRAPEDLVEALQDDEAGHEPRDALEPLLLVHEEVRRPAQHDGLGMRVEGDDDRHRRQAPRGLLEHAEDLLVAKVDAVEDAHGRGQTGCPRAAASMPRRMANLRPLARQMKTLSG